MSTASRDGNFVPTLLGVSNADGLTPITIYADPVTHRLLVDISLGGGDVVGPASATDNAVARFDGISGKLIQNSVLIVADTTGNMSGGQQLTLGVTSTASGKLLLKGVTSGTVTVQPANAAGTWTLTLPVDDGLNGQFLKTDGTGVTSWATGSGGGGTPGGNDTDIQFNDSGSFGGEDTFTFDKSTNTVTLGAEDSFATILAPDATTTDTNGGSLLVSSGAGDGAADGGDMDFTSGSGGATSGKGGDLKMYAAPATGGDSDGGDLILRAGNKSGAGTAGRFIFEALSATQNRGILNFDNVTSTDKTFTFPNVSGTIALTSTSVPTYYLDYDYIIYKSGSNTIGIKTADGSTVSSNTNSATVINAVIAASASANLYKIKILDGTYVCDASLLFTESNQWIDGMGRNTAFEFDAGTVPTLFAPSTTGFTYLRLSNVNIYQTGTIGTGTAIAFSNSSLCKVEKVNIFAANGIVLNDTTNFTFYNVYRDIAIIDCTIGINITSTNPVNDNLFESIRIAAIANGTGLKMTNGQGNTFYNLNVEPSSATGTKGLDLTTANTFANSFVGLWAEGNATGVSIGAGVLWTSFFGGNIVSNTANLSDSGTGTTFLGTNITSVLVNRFNGGLTVGANITPIANDGSALGTTALQFSDLFLASGAVINFANGNWVATHTSGILTVTTGDLRVTSANVGTNGDSVPTLSSTSTLTNKTLTSPTIQTSPVLAAATNLKFTLPSADPSATGITTNEFNSGYSSTAIGDLVYLDTSATWQKADADASAATYSSMLGIALSVAAAAAPVNVLLQGFVYAATPFPTFTIGAPVYMSATAGAVTNTAPVTTDSATRIIGYGIHADKMYFNPSNDWLTHV